MKKILLISNTSWSIYNFRYGLMKELQKSFDVSFAAPFDNYTEKLEEDFKYHQVKIDRKGKNPVKDIALLFSFCKTIKRENPDLVINYTIKPNIYGALACRIKKISFINIVTGMGHVFIKKSLLSFLVTILYKISFKYAEKTIFLNEEDLNYFVKRNLIKEKDALLFPGEGVNTEHFSPSLCTEKNDDFTFLYIGRILKEKGLMELVESFKKIKASCRLILVGKIDEGNPSAVSKKDISVWEEENNIKYYKEVEDVRDFICKSDCIVLPSYKEGLPRAILEGLSMEKVVITTNISGCKELVRDSFDYLLVEPRNITDLTEKMIRIIETPPEERKRQGKIAREKMIKEFDEKIVIKKYLEIINSSS